MVHHGPVRLGLRRQTITYPSTAVGRERTPLSGYIPPDPLGVREATAWVTQRARSVRISQEGVDSVATRIAAGQFERPEWRTSPHWWDDQQPDATATYVLLLDALNFSFWGAPKWQVRWDGTIYDGYFALAAALRRAIAEQQALTDPRFLAYEADAAHLLRGDGGTTIPLLAERQSALREVGHGILEQCGGGFAACVKEAAGLPDQLVRVVADRFPSFRDVATYEGRAVPLYKRAQILVSDLWGAFAGEGLGRFAHLESLTMFADYKVPQVLNSLGVLLYSPELEDVLRAGTPLLTNDPREVEIRAASVQAVEAICQQLRARRVALAAFDLDWRLWTLGQEQPMRLPYHRTRTVAY